MNKFSKDILRDCPTAIASKKILNICEVHADQFDITMNGRTNKVIVLGIKGLEIIYLRFKANLFHV